MPTSNSMPDVKCEIAFNGGFRVPMASWTWTDVSAYVELGERITITGGRGDERSTADANTLTLVLDNSDGRFTAERTTSPHSPNIKLYKPIRVKVDPVDGAESTRFTGYITSWPTEWEGTSAYAKATITAVSRLARLGLNAAFRSIVEETYLADNPLAYYPLGEPEGSTRANDVSGYGSAPLMLAGNPALPVVFGQAIGPPTDDLTAATFAGGQYLSGGGVTLGTQWTIGVAFSRTGLPTVNETLVAFDTGAAVFSIYLTPAGDIYTRHQPPSGVDDITATAPPYSLVDGSTHTVFFAYNNTGPTRRVYIDASTSSPVGVAHPNSLPVSLSVGAGTKVTSSVVATTFTGVISHAAVLPVAIDSTRAAEYYAAATTGHAGERTDTRFARYAKMASILAAEVTAEAGSTTMAHVDTTGKNINEMLRLTETTEGGVVFDGRDGNLTFHNRAHRYARASSLTLDMAKHEVEADYSPRLDPSALANDITAANVAGTFSAHVKDAASVLDNGVATASYTTASQDDDEPLQLASWAKTRYATPRARVPSLSVDALAQVGKTVNCAAVLAVTVGDKVTVANHPSQAAFSLRDYFVEGWTEVYGPESLTITWNVSPSSPDDMALIVGDAARGIVGTNYVAL